MARPEGQLLYREVQYFPAWTYAAGLAAAVGGFIAILGRPLPTLWGNALIMLGLLLGLWFTITLRLETEVRTGGVFVRLRPLWWIRINLDGCTSHKPVTYRPILEYGGWGIRLGWKGRAYNARGNRGVRLEFPNGRHILLGSQTPEQLDAAIEQVLAVRRT